MTDTVGRRINHSTKKINAKPFQCKMQFPEGEKDTILFKATKDIAVNEEIFFHYGVSRMSNTGEGVALEWLDD